VDGIKFPSPARMAWATLDPQTRQERLSYFAAKGWDHLTNYEKELLGRKPTANFSEGWQKLEETYSEQASQLHLQGSNMPRGQKLALAKWIDRYYVPGFLKDFYFAQKPLFQRLQLTTLVQQSKNQTQWHDLFNVAAGYAKFLVSDTYSHTSVRAGWRSYVKSPAFQSWLDATPGFRKELDRFGPDLLNGLIG